MKNREQIKPQRSQRNTLCTQKESKKGKDIETHRIDSLVEDVVIFEEKASETLPRIICGPGAHFSTEG